MGWNSFPYELKDLFVPTEPGTLSRGILIDENGAFRVSRRDCELHSVKILVQGSSALFEVFTGTKRSLFRQPSCFTGSWPLDCSSEGGLILLLHCAIAPAVQVSFREIDDQIV